MMATLVPSPVRFRVAPGADGRVRLIYAKTEAWKEGQVGPRSKTRKAECSSAASAWGRGVATPETHKQLAQCRAMSGTKGKASLQRGAGHEGRAQHLEHRIESGQPLTAKARHEEAVRKFTERVEKGKAAELVDVASPEWKDDAYFKQARRYGEMARPSQNRLSSGADRTDSVRYEMVARAFRRLGQGEDLNVVLDDMRKEWNDFAIKKKKQIDNAPKINRGPKSGMSVIEHEHADPGAIDSDEIFIRSVANRVKNKSSASKEKKPSVQDTGEVNANAYFAEVERRVQEAERAKAKELVAKRKSGQAEKTGDSEVEVARKDAVAKVRAQQQSPSAQNRIASENAFRRYQEMSGGKDPFEPERVPKLTAQGPNVHDIPGTHAHTEHRDRQAMEKGMREHAKSQETAFQTARKEAESIDQLPTASERIKTYFNEAGSPKFGMKRIRKHIEAASDKELRDLEAYVGDLPAGSSARAALGRHLMPEIHTEQRLRRERPKTQETASQAAGMKMQTSAAPAPVIAPAPTPDSGPRKFKLKGHTPEEKEFISRFEKYKTGSDFIVPRTKALHGLGSHQAETAQSINRAEHHEAVQAFRAMRAAGGGAPPAKRPSLETGSKGLSGGIEGLSGAAHAGPVLAEKTVPKSKEKKAATSEKAKAKPVVNPQEHLTKIEHAIANAKSGEPIFFGDIRRASGLNKDDFDKAIVDLVGKGTLSAHHHDYTHGLTSAQKENLVKNPHAPEGRNYMAYVTKHG